MGLTPFILGLVVSVGGIANLAGSFLAKRAADHIPLGLLLIGSTFVSGIATLLIPMAHGPALLALSQVGDVAFPVFYIHQVTLRQTIAPPELLGRVNACMQLLFKGFLPLGALSGGFLAGAFGIRAAMFVAGAGVMAAALWLVFSPVRGLTRDAAQS